MGASLALAGVDRAARIQPPEKIVPYVEQPEQIVPGKPLFFATALSLGGLRDRRARREPHGPADEDRGEPDHPASLGATDLFTQAAILDLYDPDRSQVVMHNGPRSSTWDDFLLDAIAAPATRSRPTKGRGPADPDRDGHLADPGRPDPGARSRSSPRRSGTSTSRSRRDAARAGPKLAFGEDVEPVYHLDKADVIVCARRRLPRLRARPAAPTPASFAARREPAATASRR